MKSFKDFKEFWELLTTFRGFWRLWETLGEFEKLQEALVQIEFTSCKGIITKTNLLSLLNPIWNPTVLILKNKPVLTQQQWQQKQKIESCASQKLRNNENIIKMEWDGMYFSYFVQFWGQGVDDVVVVVHNERHNFCNLFSHIVCAVAQWNSQGTRESSGKKEIFEI